jgi:hypothetical protein
MSKYVTAISFDISSKPSKADLREYIENALKSWGGAFHPEDPLFHGLENVKVSGFHPYPKGWKLKVEVKVEGPVHA